MRVFVLSFILLLGGLTYLVVEYNLETNFQIHAFAQVANTIAKPNQTVIGKLVKTAAGGIRVDRSPCEDLPKVVIFNGNYKIKELGTRKCKNGNTYRAVKVSQF